MHLGLYQVALFCKPEPKPVAMPYPSLMFSTSLSSLPFALINTINWEENDQTQNMMGFLYKKRRGNESN